ncbi:MAG: adenylate/guanylate cyclase domain-containing protein [Acidimicrobiales bacterium]
MPIPSGTVTLLFTDVEGSTHLWEDAPDQMARALERHEHVVRDAMESNGGYIFKTIGDAFCVAFATGHEALRAAAAAQTALAAESWPEHAVIKVRMALHTGVCQERDGDYFGPVVNRTARLMAIAHGGQVVVSGVTAELLADFPPDEGLLRDLGEHRLRDLGRPERVWQLDVAGLASTFPPLKSLDNPELPNNLPELLSSFVGRDEELGEVRALINEHRLVTLTGAGGSGKTRLAMQAAAELLDGQGEGVWLVELASVNDEEHVPLAVASVLGIQEMLDVSPLETLVAALSNQDVLLILDNCEHLIGACSKFADEVLRNCARVRVLATSREPLGIEGERVYRVPSMTLPGEEVETLADVSASDAVALFLGRAREVDFVATNDDAALVSSICVRLDGIPLALELAAARLSSMSLVQLHERLDQRFRLLTGGSRNVMARQQTLQALVDWSYGLLSRAEQSVLRRLSVFVGGFSLEAAESIGANELVDEFDVANVLHSLVAKSLVVADRGGGSMRFRSLETIRQYSAQKLLDTDGDEATLEVRDRHADFYVALAISVGEAYYGPQHVHLARTLDIESENLRATLTHCSQTPERSEDVLRVFIALEWYLVSRSSWDLLPILAKAMKSVGDAPTKLFAGALIIQGQLEIAFAMLDDDLVARAAAQAERGLAIARDLGEDALESRALGILAYYAGRRHDIEAAVALARESIEAARRSGQSWEISVALFSAIGGRIGDVLFSPDETVQVIEEVKAIWTAAGFSSGLAAIGSRTAGEALGRGDIELAVREWRDAMNLLDENGAAWWARSPRVNLAIGLGALGQFEEAAPLLRRSLREARRAGFRTDVGPLVEMVGSIAEADGDPIRGAQLLGAGQALNQHGLDIGTLSPNTPFEDDFERGLEERLRVTLGDEAFEREYAYGTTLSVYAATDLALGQTPRRGEEKRRDR